jgi:lipoyl(octanoyl) transferase
VSAAYLESLGLVAYADALAEMTDLAAARSQGAVPDTVILLEHEPVITLGSRADRAAELPLPEEEYRSRGIEVTAVGRGGRSTYHGPGQLVCYPILDLSGRGRDLHAYVRGLEAVILRTLADFQIEGHGATEAHASGVWVEDRKIASIGVRCARWVTSHGFSLDACGLGDARFTSVSAETGRGVSAGDLREPVTRHLADVFQLELTPLPAVA